MPPPRSISRGRSFAARSARWSAIVGHGCFVAPAAPWCWPTSDGNVTRRTTTAPARPLPADVRTDRSRRH